MAKYRKLNVDVEAVQWFPGIKHQGLVEHAPEIVFSVSHKFFYLSARFPKDAGPGPFYMPDAWLPVDDGGEVKPFAFWKVEDDSKHEPATTEGDGEIARLTRKYLEYAQVKALPEPYGVLHGDATVSAGDWIVTEPGSEQSEHYTPEEFSQHFESKPLPGDSEVPR